MIKQNKTIINIILGTIAVICLSVYVYTQYLSQDARTLTSNLEIIKQSDYSEEVNELLGSYNIKLNPAYKNLAMLETSVLFNELLDISKVMVAIHDETPMEELHTNDLIAMMTLDAKSQEIAQVYKQLQETEQFITTLENGNKSLFEDNQESESIFNNANSGNNACQIYAYKSLTPKVVCFVCIALIILILFLFSPRKNIKALNI